MAAVIRITVEQMRDEYRSVDQQMFVEHSVTNHVFTHPASDTKHVFIVTRMSIKHMVYNGENLVSGTIAFK